jgi:chromosome segregation ATPase
MIDRRVSSALIEKSRAMLVKYKELQTTHAACARQLEEAQEAVAGATQLAAAASAETARLAAELADARTGGQERTPAPADSAAAAADAAGREAADTAIRTLQARVVELEGGLAAAHAHASQRAAAEAADLPAVHGRARAEATALRAQLEAAQAEAQTHADAAHTARAEADAHAADARRARDSLQRAQAHLAESEAARARAAEAHAMLASQVAKLESDLAAAGQSSANAAVSATRFWRCAKHLPL